MFTAHNVKFHYEACHDWIMLAGSDYIAVVSNWECNAPDHEELVLAGPEPATAPTLSSAWDLSDEIPF